FVWIMGLILKSEGEISQLNDNTPVLVIFNCVGILSLLVWLWLSVKTKASAAEFAREAILALPTLVLLKWKGMGGGLGYLAFALAVYFALDLFFWITKGTAPWLPHWRKAFFTGFVFIVGACFYL